MNTIVVPVDFSDASYNSSNYAAALSNIYNANLILVHAYMNPMAIDQMPKVLLLQPEKELQDVKEDLLNENVEIIRKKFTVKVEGIVKEGMALAVIQEVVRNNNVDVIVMGMKGKGKSKSIFGSTTTAAIQKSSVPVLVIPEKAVYKNIEVITLASDLDTETAVRNYDLLKKLAHKNNAFIQILNVRRNKSMLSDKEIAGKLNTALAFPEFEHQFFVVEDDKVDEGIEDFLEDHPSDILAMVSRKHNLFKRLFGTIHTRKMTHETKIPLLVLRG